jgi:hypothetical protein
MSEQASRMSEQASRISEQASRAQGAGARVQERPHDADWSAPGPSSRAQGEGASESDAGEHGAGPRAPREGEWRRVLCAGSPREVLARLLCGDPLGLAARVEERLRSRAYLFDADRVYLRAAARCARLALRYRGDPPLQRWLAERVDEALLDLLRADSESELRGEPAGPERLAVFEALARPLGLDPARMHSACLAHNQLPQAQRQAFREVVLEGRSLDGLAAHGDRTATDIARAARAALVCVLRAVDGEARR